MERIEADLPVPGTGDPIHGGGVVLDGPTIVYAGPDRRGRGDPEHHRRPRDLHSWPLPWVADFGHREGDLRLRDGVDSCIRAAREQLRNNARLIKLCASGGVLSEVDDPIHQQFTVAEMTGRGRGRRVGRARDGGPRSGTWR